MLVKRGELFMATLNGGLRLETKMKSDLSYRVVFGEGLGRWEEGRKRGGVWELWIPKGS